MSPHKLNKKLQPPIKMKVMGILIFTQVEIVSCTLSFLQICLSSQEVVKESWMTGCKKKIKTCTSLVGRQITSSLMMYQYWCMFVGFKQNLSSITEFIQMKYYHDHMGMWEVVSVIYITYF